MVMVDSSVWIEAFRRRGSLEAKLGVEALLEEGEAGWCGPVKLEVLGGARAEERRKLEFWFDVVTYLPMSDVQWETAKHNAWQLRDHGVTAPWNDILIATLAKDAGWRIYALDKHFDAMSLLLGFSLYRPGYGGSYSADA